MSLNTGQQAAAGYANTSGGPMFPPVSMRAGILRRFWEASFVPFISSTSYFAGQTPTFGRPLRFHREPIIKVRKRQKNQKIKHDQLDLTALDVMIGEQLDYSYKIDDFDFEALWSQSEYRQSIEGGAALSAHQVIGSELLHFMVGEAACENQGSSAGKITKQYNLGAPSAPLVIDVNNIGRVYSIAQAVLAEQDINADSMTAVFGNEVAMTIVVPPAFRETMQNSKFADRISNAICDPGCSLLINGMIPRSINGFATIVSNCVPMVIDPGNSKLSFYLVATARRAVGFAGVNEKVRLVDGAPDGWDTYLQGLFTYGFDVFYPDAIVIFYVQFTA
jgi:hypothetical protein